MSQNMHEKIGLTADDRHFIYEYKNCQKFHYSVLKIFIHKYNNTSTK